MTREEALNILHNASVYHPDYLDALNMAIKSLEQEPKTEWIPIKTRPLTEAETEELLTEGSDGVEFMYDCPLPDDGQEVLVTDRYGNVETDVFYRDDGCYFETNCGEGDVKAWTPLPEPYKESEDKE